MHTDPNKSGLVGAIMLGGLHVVWSLFIGLGWAQWLLDFSMWAHMARFPVALGPFDMVAAATVIVVAAILGYCALYILATVWNKVHGT
ncbi:MAG TPA: hypothetical protein VJG64_02120 [Candidatus Paceibacterota bacterium]